VCAVSRTVSYGNKSVLKICCHLIFSFDNFVLYRNASNKAPPVKVDIFNNASIKGVLIRNMIIISHYDTYNVINRGIYDLYRYVDNFFIKIPQKKLIIT